MLKKLISYLESRVGIFQESRHEKAAGAMVPAEAQMSREVRRFQGRYTCGCTWPLDVLAPEFCGIHPEATRVYAVESVYVSEKIGAMVPRETFE